MKEQNNQGHFISRATSAEVFYSLSGKKECTNKSNFTDVLPGESYYDAVCWTLDSGVMSGYADGTFKPNQNITLEELITDFYLFAKNNGIDVITSGDSLVNYLGFSDISTYAANAYTWAIENGIYTPLDMDLHPKDYVTKDEFAKIVRNYDIKYGIHKGDHSLDLDIGETNEEKLNKIVKNAIICAENKLPYVDPNIATPNITLDSSVGTDSIGFIKALYETQGITLDKDIEVIMKTGEEVTDAKELLNLHNYGEASILLNPGDIIICNNGGHATIYIGKEKIVHESYTEKCAVIKDLKDLEYMPGIVAVRRII